MFWNNSQAPSSLLTWRDKWLLFLTSFDTLWWQETEPSGAAGLRSINWWTASPQLHKFPFRWPLQPTHKNRISRSCRGTNLQVAINTALKLLKHSSTVDSKKLSSLASRQLQSWLCSSLFDLCFLYGLLLCNFSINGSHFGLLFHFELPPRKRAHLSSRLYKLPLVQYAMVANSGLLCSEYAACSMCAFPEGLWRRLFQQPFMSVISRSLQVRL